MIYIANELTLKDREAFDLVRSDQETYHLYVTPEEIRNEKLFEAKFRELRLIEREKDDRAQLVIVVNSSNSE